MQRIIRQAAHRSGQRGNCRQIFIVVDFPVTDPQKRSGIVKNPARHNTHFLLRLQLFAGQIDPPDFGGFVGKFQRIQRNFYLAAPEIFAPECFGRKAAVPFQKPHMAVFNTFAVS